MASNSVVCSRMKEFSPERAVEATEEGVNPTRSQRFTTKRTRIGNAPSRLVQEAATKASSTMTADADNVKVEVAVSLDFKLDARSRSPHAV